MKEAWKQLGDQNVQILLVVFFYMRHNLYKRFFKFLFTFFILSIVIKAVNPFTAKASVKSAIKVQSTFFLFVVTVFSFFFFGLLTHFLALLFRQQEFAQQSFKIYWVNIDPVVELGYFYICNRFVGWIVNCVQCIDNRRVVMNFGFYATFLENK